MLSDSLVTPGRESLKGKSLTLSSRKVDRKGKLTTLLHVDSLQPLIGSIYQIYEKHAVV